MERNQLIIKDYQGQSSTVIICVKINHFLIEFVLHSRLSVRLLKTMCSKTSKSIPAEKHEMIMYLLKNPVISKQVEVVARPDPVVAKQMEAEQVC